MPTPDSTPEAAPQHTPGPWFSDTKYPLQVVSLDGVFVAQVMSSEPDRALIAAAPDLLAALEAILEQSHDPAIERLAKAAIAAVRGEAQ